MVDGDTIEAARRGRRDAQATLLTSLQDVWFRFCLSQLRGDRDLAADATQETALRFLRQLPTFRGESQLQTWSLSIALNVVRETRRRRANESLDAKQDAIAATPRVARLNEDENALLKQTLASLSDRQRQAITLRFFEELSVDQTATVMNCATGTVKATVHQALRALREKLKQLQ
ncbi:MAG: polymerase sigma-70 factor, subfamily [Phycisphaerales bacterium]|nr:polymerase sigma-70 factor, subfamily [Phycisphaerales bacterium]